MKQTPRMLILEDEQRLAELYRRALARLAIPMDVAHSLAEARQFLQRQTYALFLVDLRLPDGNAADLLREWQARLRAQGTQVIILTAEARQRDEIEALGFDYYFEKPVSLAMLYQFVSRLLSRPRSSSPNPTES